MITEENSILYKTGKILVKPLSHLTSNPLTERFTRLTEIFLSALLGKGVGAGWAMKTEVKAASKMIHTVKPVIFDLGANIGEWSYLLYQRYPQARIYMFEPQPECQQKIKERKIPGSELIPKAVSATSGRTVELLINADISGVSSLYKRRDSYLRDCTYDSLDVETVAIDSVIQEYDLSTVDFMKIDVEGHELEVLKGAQKSFKRKVIKSLSFEFGPCNINSRTYFHDFWDFLTPLGFKIYRILPSSRLMPIREYCEDCEYFLAVTNYIATLE